MNNFQAQPKPRLKPSWGLALFFISPPAPPTHPPTCESLFSGRAQDRAPISGVFCPPSCLWSLAYREVWRWRVVSSMRTFKNILKILILNYIWSCPHSPGQKSLANIVKNRGWELMTIVGRCCSELSVNPTHWTLPPPLMSRYVRMTTLCWENYLVGSVF